MPSWKKALLAPAKRRVDAERVAHRLHKSLGAARREAVFPPGVEYLHAGCSAVDPRLDPALEAFS